MIWAKKIGSPSRTGRPRVKDALQRPSLAGPRAQRHFMTPPPMRLVHFALPQQISVRRPGPPHSPLPGTHFGCSSTHFIAPPPIRLVHLALPQQVSVRRPGPPHSPLLGTHCCSSEFNSSANCCTSTHFMTPLPIRLVHLAVPQQVSVRRPGPPHSPLPGTHFGCSSTHFMTPPPMRLVHLALPPC